MGAFRKGLGYLFKDFSCWTSTHGIPHIGMANTIWLRIFWILVVIACFIGFFIQFQMLIAKYLSYDVNTETKLEFSERPFPAVTICHLNPWKADHLSGSPYMTSMVSAYGDDNANPDYGFKMGRTGERQQRAVRLTSLANEHLFALNTTGSYPGYSYEDIFISCTYNAASCNKSDFVSSYDRNFGQCQVFNFDESKVSSRAGPLYGLRVVMRTDQMNYLPWTESSGVVVAIHNKTDQAFPDVLGYYAPPGTASSMGIRYVQTNRKGPPYGTCTNAKDVSLAHYVGKYEVEACFRSCLQSEIIKKCGCYDPTYSFIPGGTTASSCFVSPTTGYLTSSNNLDCIDNLSSPDNGTFNLINDCDQCKQSCTVQTYSVTVSTAQWPSNEYKPTECTAANQTGSPWMMNGTGTANEEACLMWYKSNTLLVEIYYERMNYQVLTESPAYTLVNLVSDIGGQVGLFLGMSIISVIEIFTLVILLIYYCATHKSRKIDQAELDKKKAAKKMGNQGRGAEKDLYSHKGGDVMPPPVQS